MAWLLRKVPALIGVAGFLIVTKFIWDLIPVHDYGSYSDEDAYGIAFVLLISIWWAYFFIVAFATWILSFWLRSRSVWMLALAPTVAGVACTKFEPLPTEATALVVKFLFFTVIAALPILVGASTAISGRVRNCGHLKSTVS